MRKAPVIELSKEDAKWLTQQARSGLTSVRLAERCRVVLLAAEGKSNEEIAAALKIGRVKAGRWRSRYLAQGRAGIAADAPGRGRKPVYPPALVKLVVQKTTSQLPVGATHWSRSLMAKALDLSESTVGRIWRQHGLKPHLSRTFKVSTDPNFAEKLTDIVGLYLDAPEQALVLCCDEKSQVQALDRRGGGGE